MPVDLDSLIEKVQDVDLDVILDKFDAQKEQNAPEFRIGFRHLVIPIDNDDLARVFGSEIGKREAVLGWGLQIRHGEDVYEKKGIQHDFAAAVPDLWHWLCQRASGLDVEVCSTCEYAVPALAFRKAITKFGPTIRQPTYPESLNARRVRGGSMLDPGDLSWGEWYPVSWRSPQDRKRKKR